MQHHTISIIVALAMCCCQQRHSGSDDGHAADSETLDDNAKVKRIDGWDLAILGSGRDAKLVEWPSMKPVPATTPGDTLIARDWGFAIVATDKGSEVVEWPSMNPLDLTRKREDQIDLEDMPPLPDSRWSH
jgi:hypothetical protein